MTCHLITLGFVIGGERGNGRETERRTERQVLIIVHHSSPVSLISHYITIFPHLALMRSVCHRPPSSLLKLVRHVYIFDHRLIIKRAVGGAELGVQRAKREAARVR